MHRPSYPRALCLVFLLLCAGCADTDPYEKQGIWHPEGTNESNLRAMIAVPSDLVQGVGDGHGNSQQAEMAIERLRQDKVKDLPASGIAAFSVNSSGSGSSSSGAGASTSTGGQ